MRWNCMPGALLAVAIASPSSAQISVYIGTPPPAVVYEEPGPPPSAGFVWIEGYWAPARHHYKWVRGHWEHPPFEGACWTHPHYDHYREGWEWHEGHWAARTTTTAIGATMVMGGAIAITTTMTRTATNR